MIQLISREEVFYKSSIVDYAISNIQRSLFDQYGYDLSYYIDEKSYQAEDPYDHFEPFHKKIEELNAFAVLSYPKKIDLNYLKLRSAAFTRFFELINIKQLFLIDELKYDLVYFPFGDREKRERFKSLINKSAYNEAFLIEIDDLPEILPLFNHSTRHSNPIIWFFSVGSEVSVEIFLCDGANFHMSFHSEDREKITQAAIEAGLIMGGLEVCAM